MNQSSYLAVLAASAVGEFFAELDGCCEEVLVQIREVVGSFFGERSVAGRGVGI